MKTKSGTTSTTKMLLLLLPQKEWTLEELCNELGCERGSIYSNLYYWVKIKLVEKKGVKPNYKYSMQRR